MAEQQPSAEDPGEFQIFVATLFGELFTLSVSPHETVQEILDKLNAQDSRLRLRWLLYNDKVLEGGKTLHDYGIPSKPSVHRGSKVRRAVSEYQYKPGGIDLRLALWCLDVSGSTSEVWKIAEALSSSEETRVSGVSPPILHALKNSGFLCVGLPQQRNCWACQDQDFPEVIPTITQESSEHNPVYRAELPGEGVYQCSITGLAFEVKSAVTITYSYASWTTHLSEVDQGTLMPAGPLFHIEVQRGVVKKVFLPHFICLTECTDTGPCLIAHFKSGKMTLEKPTLLIPFYAVLENPSFSLLGVLWRTVFSSSSSVPVHSLVLIFQQLSAANTTLHLYLIPDDKSVKQAIEKQEMDWKSKFIPKPPPFVPLYFGCVYRVAGTNSVEITPDEHMPFFYNSPQKQQLFVEIYIRNTDNDTELSLRNTRDHVRVWKTLLRSGDIKLPPPDCHTPSGGCRTAASHPGTAGIPAGTGSAFVKKNKTELCSRMVQVPSILLHLRDVNVINNDEEEEVLSQDTSQKKNRVLLELLERKGAEAQEQLYQILRNKDPYLIADLEKSS
ncbi:caspase recruitment domain-containing protein 8-like isoform X2 [Cuculus canorus]|uniref:caspase recruitment domain-containing protein 8-like isoform X2 n=1 Tax=Cuculus canorus TaxID=55661 RepID=UPI0023AAE11D|nr:caspase recruitment domain-containing protein 8-like isoform X2 [Cuculus canorus]